MRWGWRVIAVALALSMLACDRSKPPPKTWQGAIQVVEEATAEQF